MINEQFLNLLTNEEENYQFLAEEFVKSIEREAARLEVTCDYYIAEFM